MDRLTVLLFSDVAIPTLSASATAMMYQVPLAVPSGIVAVVEAELLAPAPRAGTMRLPINASDASRTALLER
jgi:hypothetical protein